MAAFAVIAGGSWLCVISLRAMRAAAAKGVPRSLLSILTWLAQTFAIIVAAFLTYCAIALSYEYMGLLTH